MIPMKEVYTTGEAARMCQVSQQTIIRCFDDGSLKGFRVPGSRFRRILRGQLYRFMKENGIPTDALGKPNALVLADAEIGEEVKDRCTPRISVTTTESRIAAGMLLAGRVPPDCLVVDLAELEPSDLETLAELREDERTKMMKVIGLYRTAEPEALFDASFGDEFRAADVARAIHEQLGLEFEEEAEEVSATP